MMQYCIMKKPTLLYIGRMRSLKVQAWRRGRKFSRSVWDERWLVSSGSSHHKLIGGYLVVKLMSKGKMIDTSHSTLDHV